MAACNGSSGGRELIRKIESLTTLSSDTAVSLSHFSGFEWDRCLIAHPYVSIEQLRKKYSINLEKLANTNIETRDDISVLCIEKDSEIVACYELPRNIYSFENAGDTVIHNSNTKLHIRKIGDNKFRLKVFN